MAGLVIGGHFLLVFGHHHRAALGAHHDFVLGVLEFLIGHQALVAPRRQQRRLVDKIGQVRAGKARGAAGDDARIDIGGERDLFHVHAEDLLAPVDVGARHDHLAVETAPGEAAPGRARRGGWSRR